MQRITARDNLATRAHVVQMGMLAVAEQIGGCAISLRLRLACDF
jgi:hypothetical protein